MTERGRPSGAVLHEGDGASSTGLVTQTGLYDAPAPGQSGDGSGSAPSPPDVERAVRCFRGRGEFFGCDDWDESEEDAMRRVLEDFSNRGAVLLNGRDQRG